MMTRRYIPLCLLLLLVCCSKPDSAPSEEAPVMISLDTKAFPDPGEHTYRVGLFDGSLKIIRAQGTYCSDYVNHSATSGQWLSPCRVNASGEPLKTDGTVASSLAEADKDRSYGLRYYTNSRTGTNAYLVAMSPAKSFSSDGSSMRYYDWNPNDAVYVSNGVFSMFTASWFNYQLIYQASTSSDMRLKDRRSSVDIHIQCGELPVANIQKVILKNCVRAARWYFPDGFLASDANYALSDVTVREFATPLELVKAHGDEWSSATDTDATTVYLPSIDWSDLDFAALRPQIEIWLGNDPAKHFTAKVDITEAMEPMMHYTYNLVVSKSSVIITLTAGPWDTPSSAQSVRNTADETPAVIRTVTIEGWDPVTDTADDWATTI